jgi:hypothetical protein
LLRERGPVGDVVAVVVGLVVTVAMVIWPWIAAASVGGFDQATWQAVGRSKLVWFGLVLLVPLAGIAYWLVVRPELLRAAVQLRPAGAAPEGGPGPK